MFEGYVIYLSIRLDQAELQPSLKPRPLNFLRKRKRFRPNTKERGHEGKERGTFRVGHGRGLREIRTKRHNGQLKTHFYEQRTDHDISNDCDILAG